MKWVPSDVALQQSVEWFRIPADLRGHWHALNAYCAMTENSGTLVTVGWDDHTWLRVAGFTASRTLPRLVKAGLVTKLPGGRVQLSFWNQAAQEKAQQSREIASNVAKIRWSAHASRIAARTAEGTSARTPARTAGRDALGQEKTGQEIRSITRSPPPPPPSGGGRDRAARDLQTFLRVWPRPRTLHVGRVERVLKDLKPHMADVLDQLARDTRFYIERRPELTAHGWLRAQRWKIPRAETGEAPWVPPPKKNGHNGHNGKDRGIAWEVGWLGDPDNAGKQPPWGKSPAPELLSFLRGELERCRTGSANWAAAAARLKQAMGEL